MNIGISNPIARKDRQCQQFYRQNIFPHSGSEQKETRKTKTGQPSRTTRQRKLQKNPRRLDHHGQVAHGPHGALLLNQLRVKHQRLGVLLLAQGIS